MEYAESFRTFLLKDDGRRPRSRKRAMATSRAGAEGT